MNPQNELGAFVSREKCTEGGTYLPLCFFLERIEPTRRAPPSCTPSVSAARSLSPLSPLSSNPTVQADDFFDSSRSCSASPQNSATTELIADYVLRSDGSVLHSLPLSPPLAARAHHLLLTLSAFFFVSSSMEKNFFSSLKQEVIWTLSISDRTPHVGPAPRKKSGDALASPLDRKVWRSRILRPAGKKLASLMERPVRMGGGGTLGRPWASG